MNYYDYHFKSKIERIDCEDCGGSGRVTDAVLCGGFDSGLSPWSEYRDQSFECEWCNGSGVVPKDEDVEDDL